MSFYTFATQLEEPQLWAAIEERDTVIFQENNFEISTHHDGDPYYNYELELNALTFLEPDAH